MPSCFKNKRTDVIKEEIKLDISVGDIILVGRFKNKRIVVKTIGKDELGQPTINGMSLLKMRIEKLLPPEKQSKETREEQDMKEHVMTRTQLNKLIQETVREQLDGYERDEYRWIKTPKYDMSKFKMTPKRIADAKECIESTKSQLREMIKEAIVTEQSDYHEYGDEPVTRDSVIDKWWPAFKAAGFYGNGIDFSDVDIKLIELLGKTCQDYINKI